MKSLISNSSKGLDIDITFDKFLFMSSVCMNKGINRI